MTADGVEVGSGGVISSNKTLKFSTGVVIYQGQTVVVSYDKSVAGADAIADSDGYEVASFTTGQDGVPAVVNSSTVTSPSLPTPTNFTAVAGDAQVTLAWDAPASDSGVTRHEYRFKSDGSYSAWTPIADSAPGEANVAAFTVTGLANGTAHTFQLRAANADTVSLAVAAMPVTPAPLPFVPTTCTLNPGDVWCGTVTVGKVAESKGKTIGHGFHETWHGNGVGYMHDGRIVYGANSYRIDEAMVGVGKTDRTNGFLFFGLNRAFPAADRVRLVLHVGSASFPLREAHFESSTHTYHWRKTGLDWSSTTSVTLRLRAEFPAAPTAVTATAPPRTGGLLEVEWSAPAPAQSITGYEVKYWRATDPQDANPRRFRTKQTGSTDTKMLLYPFLDANTEYKLQVRAMNAIGTGAWSEVATERTGAKQPGKPILSLAVVDENGEGIDTIAAGEKFRYRVEVTDLLNHHQSSGTDFTGWGTLGVRGHFAIDYIYSGGKEGCHGRTLFLKDFRWMSSTTGYWEFDSADIPANAADIGPLRLRMGFKCTASHFYGADGIVTMTSDIFERGSPAGACLSVEDSSGTVTQPCLANDAGARALKARFVSPPEHHDGSGRVRVRVAFSEAIDESPETVGEHGVKVEGGRVTSVRRVSNRPAGGAAVRSAGRSGGGQEDGPENGEPVWEFEIEPGSDDDLTMRIDAGRPCDEPGAICTADERSLSEGIATTVEGPETGPPPLTAELQGMPEAHGGEDAFTFRVAFSEDVGTGFKALRDHSFTVSGGEVTGARRVDGRNDLWEITVEPGSDEAMTIALPGGRECAVSGAICTRSQPRRQLSNTPTATVAGPVDESAPAALTASFVQAPAEHDGSSPFKLRIAFSEGISIGFRTFRDQSLSAAGGSVTKAKRVDGRKDLWEVTVKPGSLGDVTVTLEGGRACGTAGAVCTGDGRALSATISTTVLGPVALSVADARVREAPDATLDFAVTLSRVSSGTVAVAYATADGSATAGSDYTARKGELTFAPGETAKTVSVPVLDDAHDEGEETLTLRLSAASGAVIADGVATGTIENTDHMPQAWLARFGRTVTDQVLEAVEARLAAPRAAGVRATLAGQALPSWDGSGKTAANDNARENAGDDASDRTLAARDREAMAAMRDWMAPAGANGDQRTPGAGPERADLVQSRELTGRDFLTGTSFALTGGSAEAGGYAALWGRGAITRFDGREGDLTLDGEVTTGLMGADWAAERWMAGLAVGHARGTGSYREGGGCEEESCSGEVEATLTGVWPYAGLKLTDRLSAWAAAGYGAGELKLTPGGESPFTADLTMAVGAAGMRGEVLTPPPEGGLALALKGDARFTRTASEATKDAKGGNLAAATADVWLVRTGIEGSRRFAPGGDGAGMVLTPSFEIGVRLDGGDAETGLGVDLGGGLAFAAPKQGIALDLKARGLVAHQAAGFREWGASASLAWDPRPSTDRGLALTLRQSWGGSPTGGMEALLGRKTLAGLAANDNGDTTASTGRLEAELGYGIAMFSGGFTGTPHLGVGLSDTGRDYRLGWRLTSARRGDPGFEINLDATRSEAANADAEHGIALRGVIRW